MVDDGSGDFVQAQADPLELQRDGREARGKVECGRCTVADGVGKTEPYVELLIFVQDVREIRAESIVVPRCGGEDDAGCAGLIVPVLDDDHGADSVRDWGEVRDEGAGVDFCADSAGWFEEDDEEPSGG